MTAIKTAIFCTALCVGLIATALNLEALLDFGLIASGGAENGARNLIRFNDSEIYEPTFKTSSQAAEAQRSAKREGRKLWIYYEVVSTTQEKVRKWMNVLHTKLKREMVSRMSKRRDAGSDKGETVGRAIAPPWSQFGLRLNSIGGHYGVTAE